MQKITVDELNILLTTVPKNTIVVVKARNKANGLNLKPVVEGVTENNPYYKNDALVKVNEFKGRVNYDWEQERTRDTMNLDYVPTKSIGAKVGGLTIGKNGEFYLPVLDYTPIKSEWYLEGKLLTKEQIETIVNNYKPVSKKVASTNSTDNMKMTLVANIYTIEILDKVYQVA